jgi:hypothetical protein
MVSPSFSRKDKGGGKKGELKIKEAFASSFLPYYSSFLLPPSSFPQEGRPGCTVVIDRRRNADTAKKRG